jgi:hypothetical protein
MMHKLIPCDPSCNSDSCRNGTPTGFCEHADIVIATDYTEKNREKFSVSVFYVATAQKITFSTRVRRKERCYGKISVGFKENKETKFTAITYFIKRNRYKHVKYIS